MVLGTGFSGSICFLIAFFLDQMDYSMSWWVVLLTVTCWNFEIDNFCSRYRSTFLAPLIYGTASLISQISVYNLIEFSLADKKSPISLGLKVQARINGVNLFWSVIVLGLTVAGYRVGYLFMIILFINLIANVINFVCQLHNSGKIWCLWSTRIKSVNVLSLFRPLVHNWLYAHMIGQFFIVLWSSNFYHVIIDLFIPITGRSGTNKNPDTTIGAICCFTTLFICSYLVSFF